jgi:ubiquinone/menaquinone biosynthesis C-methylase UbiE
MSIGKLYDKISDHYADNDPSFVIANSIQFGIDQLKQLPLIYSENLKVIDLGAGDGKFLSLLNQLNPKANLTGLDASADMLKIAKAKVDIKTFHSTIQEAHQHLPPRTFDLAIASFVCSYTGFEQLLNQGSYLLKQGSYFCVITTTKNSFSALQEQVNEFRTSRSLQKKLMYHWMKRTIDKTKVPLNRQEMETISKKLGFKILNNQNLTFDLQANNPTEVTKFARDGGWALSLLDYKFVPVKLMNLGANRLSNYFHYPFKDQIIIECCIMQKL